MIYPYLKYKLISATPLPPTDPCNPTPCGTNAECSGRVGGSASCTCLPGLQGNPYIECKPECSINPDCPQQLACMNNKCRDPCPGVCGSRATCSVQNHRPQCRCDPGLIGDPFTACYPPPTSILFFHFRSFSGIFYTPLFYNFAILKHANDFLLHKKCH